MLRPPSVLAGAVALLACLLTAPPALAGGGSEERGGGWVSGWQGSPTAGGTFDPATCPADTGVARATVRDVVPVSIGGGRVRVRISNAFGGAPLRVGAASVARSTSGGGTAGAGTVPGTLRPLRFDGARSVVVAAGAEVTSDPVALPVRALDRLALSVYLPTATGPATQHNNSRETNYLATGDATGSSGAAFTRPISCWLFASGVDVLAPRRVAGTVVALGDSITDGDHSTVDADQRFPDQLARRLAAWRGATLAVSNAGIGGNEVLADRVPALFGVSAAHRFDRDVLSQAGVRTVVYLEGTNDLGASSARAGDLIAADRALVARAHAAGLRILGATLPPFGGSHAQYGAAYGTPAADAQRQALNAWIRTCGAFDGVVDVDAALRDPADPTRMLAAYDSGDHLHPSDAGYAAMARAVDLRLLLRGR